jgi:hypothetical protein
MALASDLGSRGEAAGAGSGEEANAEGILEECVRPLPPGVWERGAPAPFPTLLMP